MDHKVKIRKIDQNDFEFVYQSLSELENEILQPSNFRKIFTENIDNPNYCYLIAECQYKQIGLSTFHTQSLLHHCGLVGEIQEFYSVSNYRNRGVGRELFQRIMDFADQYELKCIEVTTNKMRKENMAIYQNLGFTLTHHKFTICK